MGLVSDAPSTVPPEVDARDLPARARELMGEGRKVVGVVGAPGSGKSTLAERVATALGDDAVVVPMDGFHLTDEELRRLGRLDRKGAPDTFDVGGFVDALRRVRRETGRTIYLPEFDRSAELSVAGAIAVRPRHRLVVTEGNYLLLQAPGWEDVRPLLDEVWYVEADEATRVARLIQRHVRHGKQPEAAERWATTTDQVNAELVALSRSRADLIVRSD